MQIGIQQWDYVIATASAADQAKAYEARLRLRRRLGLLAGARDVLVLADPGGKRIGSGGSTIYCLSQVVGRELAAGKAHLADPQAWLDVLRRLRVLIIHAGGDSRRLPAYGPCGKLFVPVPGESDSAIAPTLFDRQLPTYLALPPAPPNAGQVVITAGDVLLSFDPESVEFAAEGMTGLCCRAAPKQASEHGVYCAHPDGRVRLYLQKPSAEAQADAGAVDRYGQSLLDIGVIHFDAATAVTLMKAFGVAADAAGGLAWSGELAAAIEAHGLDLYREVCCAIGAEATFEHYLANVRPSGSAWPESVLRRVCEALGEIPFHVRVLPQCGFLHFGTTRQLISSGVDLLRSDRGLARCNTCLSVTNEIADGAGVIGENAWVEGCRIGAELRLRGLNVVTGADVNQPLSLPRGACLDVVAGRDRAGRHAWFVRCYGVQDTFKDALGQGATLCNRPIAEWLAAVGATPADVWADGVPDEERSLWNARVFPAAATPDGCGRWLWMYDPGAAGDDEKKAWLAAERYSPAEIASLADPAEFHARRREIRWEQIRRSLRRMFRQDSGFSAAELAWVLAGAAEPAAWVAQLLQEAHWHSEGDGGSGGTKGFGFSRIVHTVATAVSRLAADGEAPLATVLPGLGEAVAGATRAHLESLGLGVSGDASAGEWVETARAAAFDHLGRTIVASVPRRRDHPVSALRGDEIVWGRAPARLDLGGGWSDTPPYCLECGGCVLNAAVNLNAQPPIQAYARVIREPVVRIGSIDLGTRIEIDRLEDLLDYRSPDSAYALAKAALAISGLSPDAAAWPDAGSLRRILERFGGGIELTTLAAIPKGSGLGTSSIIAAVILAVVARLVGRTLTRKELFHGVLRLEQALTTGGGWQDQIGGAVDGVKVIRTEAGLVPDPSIHYVPGDVLDPRANGGATLLYYTGITRLAKNILQHVVGRYLDRDRRTMDTLRRIHALPPMVADAMARKDIAEFGRLIDTAWELNKRLDPDSTNEEIELLLDRVRPHVHGAKLLGAGGGGFLLMVCKSPDDARAVRGMLAAEPANERARFFDFDINAEGAVVTVC